MEHIEKTIEELKQKIAEREKELNDEKAVVNKLCAMVNKPAIYAIEEEAAAVPVSSLRGDEYYGRPFAGVVTTVLENRKIQGIGPATVKEIYEQMTAGGYQFDTKNEANAMRGMRISMTKNIKFHKLPNGKWGLTEWYPKIKADKGSQIKDELEENTDDTTEETKN